MNKDVIKKYFSELGKKAQKSLRERIGEEEYRNLKTRAAKFPRKKKLPVDN